MPKETRSFATKDGKAFYKQPGRYYEVRRSAKRNHKSYGPSSLKQKFLVSKLHTGAASGMLKQLKKELGI